MLRVSQESLFHIPVLITAVTAVVLYLFLFVLSTRVSLSRAKHGASLTDDGNPELIVKVRQCGNFTEFVPFILILMLIAELNGVEALVLTVAGVIFVISRIGHPLSLDFQNMHTPLRSLSHGGTLLTGLICIIAMISEMVN